MSEGQVSEWERTFFEEVEELKAVIYERNKPPEWVDTIMRPAWDDYDALLFVVNYFTDAEPPLNLCNGISNEAFREHISSHYLQQLRYDAGHTATEPDISEYCKDIQFSAEALHSDVMAFLRFIFEYVKQHSDQKTLKGFARRELEEWTEEFEKRPEVKEAFELFQVAKDYLRLLKDIDDGRASIVEADSELRPVEPATKQLIERLNQYQFGEFHNDKGLNLEAIHAAIAQHAGREQLPFCIALMDETGYLLHLCKTYFKGIKKDVHIKLATVFDSNETEVKKQWLVLNPNSGIYKNERDRYTAHQYKETIVQLLKGQK